MAFREMRISGSMSTLVTGKSSHLEGALLTLQPLPWHSCSVAALAVPASSSLCVCGKAMVLRQGMHLRVANLPSYAPTMLLQQPASGCPLHAD
eukprot:1157583-Pelagomonas_calceolata.AAC.7